MAEDGREHEILEVLAQWSRRQLLTNEINKLNLLISLVNL